MRIHTRRQLIWFEAKTNIEPGEELTFNYSDETSLMLLCKWGALLLGVGGLVAYAFGVQVNSPLMLTCGVLYVIYELF